MHCLCSASQLKQIPENCKDDEYCLTGLTFTSCSVTSLSRTLACRQFISRPRNMARLARMDQHP
ncbi:hypothetical protein JMJ77_0010115, partial [Colletotrichum scovillei]